MSTHTPAHGLRACSHLVIATPDVPRITAFFGRVFGVTPHFENDMFSEFVLPSGFRIAFFKPVGPTASTFDETAPRTSLAIGVTVDDVDGVHALAISLPAGQCGVSGPPKEHPWGERSFLLTDPDGNRWEVTKSPTPSGMLRNL